MPLNYRVRPEADCTPLPKFCIICLYERTSKPHLSILKKQKGPGWGGGWGVGGVGGGKQTLYHGEQSSSP